MPAWKSPRKRRFVRTYSPLRARLPGYPRSRLLRWLAIIAILTLCVAALRRDLVRIYHLPLRFAETNFTGVVPLAELRRPAAPLRMLGLDGGLDLDDRYVYVRDLGHGGEGTARLYEDRASARSVVIKSWDVERGNPLPPELRPAFPSVMRTWPTEIQATLLFAGLEPANTTELAYPTAGFLPAVDYFVAVARTRRGVRSHSWRLVTPYVHGGTLDDLARRLRRELATTRPDELDSRYRTRFHDLLVALEGLHSRGYCHDDIKSDNVLVLDSATWVLADLGHVRQIGHPYHDSAGWTIRNQWRDCRANDARRLLKTYLSFLRAASVDRSGFDEDLFGRDRAWSRLYWDYAGHPKGATELLELSAASAPERNETLASERAPSTLLSRYRSRMLDIAATSELACIPVRWSWSIWGWIGWLRSR